MSDQALRKYASRPAPRYTSYPTAPHFETDFDPAVYRDWLSRLNPDAPVSLYLHVPYCAQMCWYCGCNMKLATRRAPVAAYVDGLIAEIALVAAALPARMTVSHLHLGGGTPTAISPDDLTRIMASLRAAFDFAPEAELALESDPRTLSDAMVSAVGEEGFTRASFGVQEFDPAVQAAINRVQPPDMVADAVARLRGVGVRAVNFDLIYGLPHQTAATLVGTVATCAALSPDRFALFGYAHVPWMAKNQRMIPEDALPGATARAEQARAAAEALQAAGYDAVGLDHFALPDDPLARAARAGTLRRNFQGYTTDIADTLIGIGATSVGRTPLGYVQNVVETGAWARAIADGVLPVGKGFALSADDRLRGYVIERLMCDGAVDLGQAADRFRDPDHDWTDALERLAPLEADGVVARHGGQIVVADAGRALIRLVAAAFDRYLDAGRARHSVAV